MVKRRKQPAIKLPKVTKQKKGRSLAADLLANVNKRCEKSALGSQLAKSKSKPSKRLDELAKSIEPNNNVHDFHHSSPHSKEMPTAIKFTIKPLPISSGALKKGNGQLMNVFECYGGGGQRQHRNLSPRIPSVGKKKTQRSAGCKTTPKAMTRGDKSRIKNALDIIECIHRWALRNLPRAIVLSTVTN